MKPPIVNFTPFAPSRVEPLRNWREKDLREGAQVKHRIKLDKAPRKPKSPKAPQGLALPPGIDPAMILNALRNLRK